MAKTERVAKITKRLVDASRPAAGRYIVWDTEIKGFGLRIEPSGAKSYVFRYRNGRGRHAALRQMKIGQGAVTPDQARKLALQKAEAVSRGEDPKAEADKSKAEMTLREVVGQYLALHAETKLKPRTAKHYSWTWEKYVLPVLGDKKISSLDHEDFAKLHHAMRPTPRQANAVIAVAGALFKWARTKRIVDQDWNPVANFDKYKEYSKQRFLQTEELESIGAALRLGEQRGFERRSRTDKNAPKSNVSDVLSPHAAAAIRLLLFTGARLREILDLRWQHVDFERGLLLLPDSKTGAKIIILNAPALSILTSLPRVEGNPYVIVGTKAGSPLADLKRPWAALCRQAKLSGVRLHDLRHTFASFGAGASLGLPMIGKLLGHSQAATTQRYAHLADDPLRRASETISTTIAAAMGEALETSATGEVIKIGTRR